MTKVSFCTSFNQEIFDLTGRRLIDTLLKYQPDNEIYVAYEEMQDEFSNEKIITTDILQDELLISWLKNNKDIIPNIMGGKADPSICHCETKKHIQGCPFSYFNSRASKWFRKVVALNWAAEQTDADILYWLDSDCLLKKHIPTEFTEEIMGSFDTLYLYGKPRKRAGTGVEASIIVFKKPFTFIKDWLEFFISGEFRKEYRWDDGYIFARMILYKDYNAKDLVSESNQRNVVNVSPFRFYIDHYKGSHTFKALGDDYNQLFKKVIQKK